MIRSTDPTDQDQQVLRKAALKIALRISAVCALLVLCLLAAATLYLLNQAGHPEPIETGAVYAYLDTNDLVKAMIIAGVAGTLLAGGIGWLSARSAIRPLGEALALQRRFIQDASHEMRTPLAILDARIQLAQRTTTPDTPTGQALARIRADTASLTLIVNELLESATGTPHQPNGSPADVAGVAKDVMDNIRPLAAKRGITLEYSGSGQPRANIPPQRLHRAILGLAENALAHTPPGGHITIAASTTGNRATITVTDSGTGITGIDRDRIFDRFARTTHQRDGQEPRSFGIGLSLVRDIAAAAGGTAEVLHTGPEGTGMRIDLPLATS
ncbi:HAMP domain-containing sensor histidine kinase [Pseudarthrobacter sp. MEB009]|uniref:sensor histidine kinase n=1 Tax=Pseudarthrobacter sp. MEB009 TaxID=3040326 RepID=UPI002552DF3D|nr:HAMP domain-containing sensor histidine kinase [Pseudarthrobacter sp. MEB009]